MPTWFLPVLAALLLAGQGVPAGTDALQEGPTAPGEGPLENDVFLPVAREAERRLAQGDAAYAALVQGSRAGGDRAWVEVLESWHQALEQGVAGDSVAPRPWNAGPAGDSPWPDPDGTAGGGASDRPVRRTESLEGAVLRRLQALPDPGRRAWSTRFSSLAEEALAAAGRSEAGLGEVERLHPATPAAGRAALARAEQELEAGRVALAQAWLERADLHAALAGEAELAAGVRRRLDLIGRLAPPPPGEDPGGWRRASSLEFLAEVPLEDLSQRRFLQLPRPGLGVQPGCAWLDDERAAVQTETRLVVLELARGRRLADFSPVELLAGIGAEIELRDPPREPPGWPARPAASAGRLVAVLRSEPPALLALRLDPPTIFGGLLTPRLEWAVVGGRLLLPGESAGEPLAGWPDGEVQPGPLAFAGSVFVQVHQRDDDSGSRSRAHLVALDLASGRVRWSRLLARGAPLARSSMRFVEGTAGEAVGQPLARIGGRIFAGTHLGAGVLVEACDGRPLWSFVHRRRPGRGDRWSGSEPPVFPDPPGLLFAPADSDRAYWLRAQPVDADRPLLLHAPLAIGEAELLLGGDARRALVLSRSGRERTLVEWDAVDGSRREAPWLAPGEVFTGPGLVAPERALFATDRAVYLHDRGRELFLLDHASYPEPLAVSGTRILPPAAAGGTLVARGSRVLVIGPHALWILDAR